MKNLYDLIHSLKPDERKEFEKYYLNLKGSKAGQSIKLFKIFSSEKACNDVEACKILYGKNTPPSTYSSIKNRLFNDIIHFYYTINENKFRIYSNLDKILFCRKQIAVADILIARSKNDLAFSILKDVLKIAIKYELVMEVIMAKELLALIDGTKYGEDAFKSYMDEEEEDLLLLKETKIAKNEFLKIQLIAKHSKNKEFTLEDKLEDAINLLKSLKNFDKSTVINFHYLHLKVILHQVKSETDEAFKTVSLQKKLIDQEAALNCKTNKANTYFQLSNLSLQCGKNKEAYQYAMESIPNFIPNGYNNLLALEKAFLPLVHLKDTVLMKEVIRLADKNPYVQKKGADQDKWKLYEVYYYYLSGEFNSAIQILNQKLKILKDSSGWFTGYKLIEIYTLYALNEKELLEYRINAFEKLAYRTFANINSGRLKLIAKVLINWENLKFDFNKTITAHKEIFDQLTIPNENTKDNNHHPLSSEVISFTDWFVQNGNNAN